MAGLGIVAIRARQHRTKIKIKNELWAIIRKREYARKAHGNENTQCALIQKALKATK